MWWSDICVVLTEVLFEGLSDLGYGHIKSCSKDTLPQMHMMWTMPGLVTSSPSFGIHNSAKAQRDERMEPSIHTEYFRTGGAVMVACIAWCKGLELLLYALTISVYIVHTSQVGRPHHTQTLHILTLVIPSSQIHACVKIFAHKRRPPFHQ